MYRRILLGVFLLLTHGLYAHAADESAPGDEVLAQAEAPPGGDFTLQSAKGPVSTEALRGKVIMLYFGYTKCPDVCPTSLSFMTQALNELSDDELKKITSIFVSVDPKRDTVDTLADYVSYFHDNFIGVTGSEEELARVAKLYGAKYYEVELEGSAFGYSVNHSAATYLIDQQGELRFIFPHKTPPSVILEAIRYLFAERS